jgi:lipopolysaccharide export system protein LptA
MRALLVGTLALLAALGASPSEAQTIIGGVPNALQGFSVNRDKPVRINAATLEVRDKEKKATFIGNVQLVQGDTTMKSATLDVYYEEGGGQAGEAGGQQIRRLEAKGGVLVTQKDQTATGETGVFDMRANTVTLVGNVVITQCQNVIRGDRLTVDLTTGVSRVESGKPGETRVEGLFLPNSARNQRADAGCGGPQASGGHTSGNKDAQRPAAKTAPQRPLKLN